MKKPYPIRIDIQDLADAKALGINISDVVRSALREAITREAVRIEMVKRAKRKAS